MEDPILLTQHDGVACMTFNRPERLNALTRDHMVAFGDLCRNLAEDSRVRAVVITGAGRAFSSGADLKALRRGGKPVFDDMVCFAGTRLDFIGPLLKLSKPTIAAVNGIAVGAGLGIALACDIRLVGASGAFLANFRDHGIAATDGIPFLLPRLVGVAKTMEILYSGQKIDAETALAVGLANHVYPDVDLLHAAMMMAAGYADAAPVALQSMKAAVMNSLGKSWDEAVLLQELAYLSTNAFGKADMLEAQAARVEKRAPTFTGSLPVSPD